MKKIILFALLIGLGHQLSAQKADWESMAFDYLQYPTDPLKPDAKKYTIELFLDVKSEVEAMKQQHAEENAVQKEAYQQKLSDYNKQMDKTQTAFGRLMVGSQRPEQTIAKDETYYPKVRNENLIKNTIKIEGLQSSSDAFDFKVQVFFKGFQLVSIQDRSTDRKYKQINYTQIIMYRAIDKEGNAFAEGLIKDSDNPDVNFFETQGFASVAELNNYWKANRNTLLSKADEDSYRNYRDKLNKELTSRLGFPIIKYQTQLAKAKGKEDYSSINKAFTDAFVGLNYQKTDISKAKAELQKAVDVWEKEILTANIEDKNARINEKILAALHLNCVEAYMWMGSFDKANEHLIKVGAMDEGYSTKNKINERKMLMDDLQKRYKANNI